MFRALTENQIPIPISEAKRSGTYFCPACGEKLNVKGHYLERVPGHQRMHFAHFQSESNTCPIATAEKEYESNDKSEWHKNWQDKFAIEHQEYWMKGLRDWFRADVFLEEQKRVIEFQHSPLSVERFEKRNNFYQSQGITVIWLFDFDNYKKDERIEKISLSSLEETKPNWVRVLRSKNQIPYTLIFYDRKFGSFKPQLNPNVQLFFSYTEAGVTRYRKIIYVNDNYSIITTQPVKNADDFIDICKSDSLFTPVKDIEEAIEADRVRMERIKEEKARERANSEKIGQFIMQAAHNDVFGQTGKPLQIKTHLQSKASGEIAELIESWPAYKLEDAYDRFYRNSTYEYQQSIKALDQKIFYEIDAILKEKFLNEDFLSTAGEKEIAEAWDFIVSEIKKLHIGENIDAQLNNRKSGLIKHLHHEVEQLVRELSLEHIENIINTILTGEDLDIYTYDSFIKEIWNRLSSNEQTFVSERDIRQLDNLYVTFMRTQAINHSKKNIVEPTLPEIAVTRPNEPIPSNTSLSRKQCAKCGAYMLAKTKSYGPKYWQCSICGNIEARR